MRHDDSFLRIVVAAVIAFFGRELIPLAVYAFNDKFIGWLVLFLFFSAVMLMFKYGDDASSEKKRADYYEDRCHRLQRENDALKNIKEREYRT